MWSCPALRGCRLSCCDEETYDDEVFLYYRLEDAKEKAKQLAEEKYADSSGKAGDKQLLAFYTSLYTMGVNCLAVNQRDRYSDQYPAV